VRRVKRYMGDYGNIIDIEIYRCTPSYFQEYNGKFRNKAL